MVATAGGRVVPTSSSSRQRQREFGIEEESNWPVPLGCREIRVESRCEVGRLFLYPYGDHDYYYCRYPIIYVITLGAKAELEHALEHSAGEQRTTTTTTTRVLDGCCVPAGVTLESSSSYALARSLAHPDRAGEPRTRPPTEDTPHIDRNLARSEPRPPISLTIANRRQGHTSAQQRRERSILAQLPGVPFRTLNRTWGHTSGARTSGHACC